MLKRIFDLVVSSISLILLSPLFVYCYLLVWFTSGQPVFFKQIRVGKNNQDFKLYKFRTMHLHAPKGIAITTGTNDPRITKAGSFLRHYKLDEIPQLFNVISGDMSLVGPRPEVRKYVSMYSQEQMKVLSVKPGITDYASIEFRNEGQLLEKSDQPETLYIQTIMPAKLELNMKYIRESGLLTDIKILFLTFYAVVKSK